MSTNIQALFSVLTDDPSGAIWIIAVLNLLSIACGTRPRIWQAKAFKILIFAQLLLIPIVAAIGFHYAVRPPA
ncbi:hypothetical protein [Burkholderia guangdongensis]|uniref:hypothetical protein n=1 Tax=Burkholderia guangdongensis TaxID=1792500 RepID=UPI0015C73482|nr:hypothetical protein [Burkholderia guangdongensis]